MKLDTIQKKILCFMSEFGELRKQQNNPESSVLKLDTTEEDLVRVWWIMETPKYPTMRVIHNVEVRQY